MREVMSPDLEFRIKTYAVAKRTEVESLMFGRPSWFERTRVGFLRLVGAAAVGVFAAGVGVFVTVIVLNLFFHYSPT